MNSRLLTLFHRLQSPRWPLSGMSHLVVLSAAGIVFGVPGPGTAQESVGSEVSGSLSPPAEDAATADGGEPGELSSLVVLGSREAVFEQLGAAAYVDTEEIRSYGPVNVNRVLDRVPGVYVREEDGYGNFPNISLRGADGTRSEKATIMEDGVLSAPAPYSAPGAYYSPRAGRMSAIEILKGSSQVRYGPHTTGGVINYLSTRVPSLSDTYARYTYGTDDTHLYHLYHGATVPAGGGEFGYLLELFGGHSDGFRAIDGHDGRGTGYDLFEPMLKLFWRPGGEHNHRVEFKLGYSDFDADESYLGQSETDARRRPDARYASTLFDNIGTDHLRTYVRHAFDPTENSTIENTIYYNRFKRNWYKIDHVGTGTSPAVDSRGRIAGRTALSVALLDDSPALPVLKGTRPGAIGVKANNRKYESYGWQMLGSIDLGEGDVRHSIQGGVRLHYDYEDRFQWVDVYNGDGDRDFDRFRSGRAGEDEDRRQSVFATSVYLEDEITWGALRLRPGARYEHLELESDNRGDTVSGSLDTWAAGVGFAYEISPSANLFGGIYRGISTPGPTSYLVEGIDEETSIGYELGARYRTENSFTAELVGFFTDYENLVGTDTGLGLGGGSNLNAGEADVYGLEAMVSYDLAAAADAGFAVPVYLSATWTQSELKNALASGGGGNIYAGGPAGADIPYVPEWKLAAGIGLEARRFGLRFDVTYTDDSHGTAKGLDQPDTTTREGRIDSLWLADVTGYLQVTEKAKLIAGVQNAFDDRGITSRIPEGPRSNAPRSFFVGFEVEL